MTAPATLRGYNDGVADWTPTETAPIVARAQAGDPAAVTELYRRYGPVIFRFVYIRIGNRPLAEDISGDVWVRALKSLHNYEDQGRDLGAWLITIARNLMADYFKSGRFRLEVTIPEVNEIDRPDTGWSANPEGATLDYLSNRVLLAAVMKLPDDQRECVVLRFLRGLSVLETAAVMGKNKGAVKALTFRAVRALARQLPDGFMPGITTPALARPKGAVCRRCGHDFDRTSDRPRARLCIACVVAEERFGDPRKVKP